MIHLKFEDYKADLWADIPKTVIGSKKYAEHEDFFYNLETYFFINNVPVKQAAEALIDVINTRINDLTGTPSDINIKD